MSILNFLKKIKLPSFEDEFIVDPVDQEVSPEHGRRMRALAAMHREKEARQMTSAKNAELREMDEHMQQEWDLHSDPSDAASLVSDDV